MPLLSSNKNSRLSNLDKRNNIFTRDLQILEKCNQEERSYFSQIAQSYGQYSWWQKILLAIGVIGIVFFLGFIMHSLALISAGTVFTITLSAIGIYTGIIILFRNHNSSEATRLENLKLTANFLENNVNNSIEALNHTNEQLTNLFEDTSNQHSILAQFNQQLNKQTSQLKPAVESHKKIVSELQETSTDAQNAIQNMTKKSEQFCQRLEDSQEEIKKNIEIIQQTGNQFDSTNPLLIENNKILVTINQELSNSGELLKGLNTQFEEQAKHFELLKIKETAANAEMIQRDKEIAELDEELKTRIAMKQASNARRQVLYQRMAAIIPVVEPTQEINHRLNMR